MRPIRFVVLVAVARYPAAANGVVVNQAGVENLPRFFFDQSLDFGEHRRPLAQLRTVITSPGFGSSWMDRGTNPNRFPIARKGGAAIQLSALHASIGIRWPHLGHYFSIDPLEIVIGLSRRQKLSRIGVGSIDFKFVRKLKHS